MQLEYVAGHEKTETIIFSRKRKAKRAKAPFRFETQT